MTRWRPTRLLAMLATTTVLAGGLAACGGGGPLSSLSGPQRHQLDAVWVARIAATDGAKITPGDRDQRVKDLYAACQQVAPGQPFLAAVVASCGPVSTTQKLGSVLDTRCARPTGACVRALDRLAEATDQLAAASKVVNDQIAQVTDDAKCKAHFVTPADQLTAYAKLSAAYRTFALGSDQKAGDIANLGRRNVEAALKAVTPSGTVDARTKALRADCQIDDAN